MLKMVVQLDGGIDGGMCQDEEGWENPMQANHEAVIIQQEHWGSLPLFIPPSSSLSLSHHALLSSHIAFCHQWVGDKTGNREVCVCVCYLEIVLNITLSLLELEVRVLIFATYIIVYVNICQSIYLFIVN